MTNPTPIPGSDRGRGTTPVGTPATAAQLSHLNDARRDLLALHQVLLHAERVRYERVFGRIGGNGAFLQLALNDPWFTWLRPMMRLVSELDTRLVADEVMSAAEAESLARAASELLRPDPDGSGFQREFAQLLQESPEVAVLHRQLVRGRSASQ